ncbi:hypothetical protein OB236_14820 [Paenibacillus sp. WQ 127069]|uniref:F5/8 type C domain-containing protein n=1 Tax=Paenibacillus baimaensis TaxID=2982185 RepID=A0ABT2UFG0_9BACL|nr:hypothetical protein [Paenibacillus sp. WQ 127069]MCU6793378.1 hypothetical protein [Paenibacillus sp. WQ 127069]
MSGVYRNFFKIICFGFFFFLLTICLIEDLAGAQPYSNNDSYYDESGRLVYEIGSEEIKLFKYDLNGNLLDKTVLKDFFTLEDTLNDWSQTYSHTDNLTFDIENSTIFEGDSSRVSRTTLSNEEIVWKQEEIKTFQAITYALEDTTQFDVYVSMDGTNWIKTKPLITKTPGTMKKHVYTLANIAGANYIKMHWNHTEGVAYSPQVSKVILNYEPNVQKRGDTLNDWSQTYSHTDHLTFDTENSDSFGGDSSRVSRTTSSNEEIVWKQEGTKTFQAITYAIEDTTQFDVLVSMDGINWLQMEPLVTKTSGPWKKHVYTLANLTGANYIKMRWNHTEGEIWSPQIGKVILNYEPNIQKREDSLNDWSQTYSHSNNLAFDIANSGSFGDDSSRVSRTTLSNEEIVWKQEGTKTFQAITYAVEDTTQFDVYVSMDGTNWSQSKPLITKTSGPWKKHVYTLVNLTGANYIKMRWNHTEGEIWSPQIGKVILNYEPNIQKREDTLNDWSQTYSHSSNLTFDTANSGSFGGDSSRVSRTALTNEEIVWKQEGTKTFQAITYGMKDSTQFDVSVSMDGTHWLQTKPQITKSRGTLNKHVYTLANLMGANYIKMRWNHTEGETWSPQISKVILNYESSIQKREDALNDWSQTYSHSNNLAFDIANSGSFGDDSSRVSRTTLSNEEIVWKQEGTKTFQAITYAVENTTQFDMYVSMDGTHWLQTKPLITKSTGTLNKHVYTLTNLTGANYIKMRWNHTEGAAWSPQISKVVLNYELNVQKKEDTLNDWSQTFSHSANLIFDNANSASFGGDSSRVARATSTEEEMVWKQEGIRDFQAVTYFHPTLDPIHHFSFYTSMDGVVWNKATPVISGGEGNWIRYIYTLSDLTAVNYVKMKWNAGGTNWNPQISRVLMNYIANMESRVDNLNDWSGSYSHTNVVLDTTPNADMDNDSSRAARSTTGDEEIIWKQEGIRDFQAVAYYHPTLELIRHFSFYTSMDGVEWSAATPVISDGEGSWIQYIYTLSTSKTVDYVKMKWNAGGTNWNPQISRVIMNY